MTFSRVVLANDYRMPSVERNSGTMAFSGMTFSQGIFSCMTFRITWYNEMMSNLDQNGIQQNAKHV
jgi:hypothetical protein